MAIKTTNLDTPEAPSCWEEVAIAWPIDIDPPGEPIFLFRCAQVQ